MFLQTSKNISVHTATKRFAHTEKLRSAKFGLNNNVKTVANYQRIFAVVKTITLTFHTSKFTRGTAKRNVSVCSKCLVATENFRLVRLKVFQTSMQLRLFTKETAIVLQKNGRIRVK